MDSQPKPAAGSQRKTPRAVYHDLLPLLLTQRAAAHLLHTDRCGEPFRELLRSKRLRLVPAGRGVKIPLEDVQRVAREGFSCGTKAARVRPRRGGAAPGVGNRIRSIEVDP